MKHLRQIAWNTLAGLSALLCVATCFLWVLWTKPYSHVGWRPKHENPNHLYSITAYNHTGGCQVVISWNLDGDLPIPNATTVWNRPSIKVWHTKQAQGGHYLASEFEYRLPVALLAVTPIGWIFLRLWTLYARKPTTGYCPSCGYDLRATPARCPECGAIAAPTMLT